MTYTYCCVYSIKTPDDGQKTCPTHVELYSKNKFEKLVHLVGLIIRILCRTSRPLKAPRFSETSRTANPATQRRIPAECNPDTHQNRPFGDDVTDIIQDVSFPSLALVRQRYRATP